MLRALLTPEAPPSDFPNRLATPRVDAAALPAARWALLGLFLLCLAPRAWMAACVQVICPDGVLYIGMAEGVMHDSWLSATRWENFNTYPYILAGLRALGLDWQTAGEWWGVLASSLAVLPLFGWVRRQFDDRVALAAGLLYAVHPGLIRWSPELMRDSTFWLLMMTSLYLSWRAVTELRLRWFVASGVVTLLAAYTRFEGWFLLVPLLAWSLWRGMALAEHRGRLVAGVAASLVGLLVCTAAIEGARGDFADSLGSFNRLVFAKQWLAAVLGGADEPAVPGVLTVETPTAPANPPVVKPVAVSTASPTRDASVAEPAVVPPADVPLIVAEDVRRMRVGPALWMIAHTLRRGFDSVFGLLLLGGVIKWRRVWSRRDHQPMFYVALLVLLSIWVHFWYSQETASRYAFTIVLAGIGFAALAWLSLVAWLSAKAERWFALGRPVWLGAGLTAALFVFGWHTAQSVNYAWRDQAAELGQWLATREPRSPVIAYFRGADIAAYYTGLSRYNLPLESRLEPILDSLENPDIGHVIVFEPRLSPTATTRLLQGASRQGFHEIAAAELPEACRGVGYRVLERSHSTVVRLPDPSPR